jgi:hypothetical protein
MASADRLPWSNLAEVHAAAAQFLDPVLATPRFSGRWLPSAWCWRAA